MLKDEAFDLPTAPAIAARKSAKCVLTWCTKNNEEMTAFAGQLTATLEVCFTDRKKVKIQKEKMWEQYYTLRATNEFADTWASFLRHSGAEPSQTLYQHITDIVFNHLIKEHFTITSEPTQDTCNPTLDYNEKNALRYISGYITRQIYRNLKDSRHKLKDELCLCLAEINDVDPYELNDDSNEWMSAVDRGGLKHVTNMTYCMFSSMEIEVRRHIQRHSTSDLNILAAKKKIMESDDVLFYWSMVSSSWEEEVASVLLDMLVSEYVKIRGHSTASAWLEKYKRESKRSVQKSKGVRKQLISNSTSSSSKDSPSSNTAED